MKRWDKTVKISEAHQEKIQLNKEKKTWLVITESWCGDAAHVMPVLHKVAALNPSINLRVVLRDENDELMNAFLTNGNRAIPKLIIISDATEKVTGMYGPRPSEATKMVQDYKKEHGELTPEFKEDLQRWYNKNKGQNVVEDLIKLI
jgi:thiol-disulfide isomerase/thioredoxin